MTLALILIFAKMMIVFAKKVMRPKNRKTKRAGTNDCL
jgi:hypothetical protein